MKGQIVGLSDCSRGKDLCHDIYDLPQYQDTQLPLGGTYTGPTLYTGNPAKKIQHVLLLNIQN